MRKKILFPFGKPKEKQKCVGKPEYITTTEIIKQTKNRLPGKDNVRSLFR